VLFFALLGALCVAAWADSYLANFSNRRNDKTASKLIRRADVSWIDEVFCASGLPTKSSVLWAKPRSIRKAEKCICAASTKSSAALRHSHPLRGVLRTEQKTKSSAKFLICQSFLFAWWGAEGFSALRIQTHRRLCHPRSGASTKSSLHPRPR
jgi:hypothetical protein